VYVKIKCFTVCCNGKTKTKYIIQITKYSISGIWESSLVDVRLAGGQDLWLEGFVEKVCFGFRVEESGNEGLWSGDDGAGDHRWVELEEQERERSRCGWRNEVYHHGLQFCVLKSLQELISTGVMMLADCTDRWSVCPRHHLGEGMGMMTQCNRAQVQILVGQK